MAPGAAAIKAHKGIAMEGGIATRYARNTGANLDEFRAFARKIAAGLHSGAVVLEIAPGPGYLAIELAKLGAFRITGLDISQSFVRIASEKAGEARVDVEFRQGNASELPFAANWFDFIVTRAAFKNFGDPVGALREMHRVLRPGGVAMIVDMAREATNDAIAEEVSKMNLPPLSAFTTRFILRWLRRRAYSRSDFASMIGQTGFGHGEISAGGIGFEVRLTKEAGAAGKPAEISATSS